MNIVFRLYGTFGQMLAVDADYLIDAADRMRKMIAKVHALGDDHLIFDEYRHRFKALVVPYTEEWFGTNHYDLVFVDQEIDGEVVWAHLVIDGWNEDLAFIVLPEVGETSIFSLTKLKEEYCERSV